MAMTKAKAQEILGDREIALDAAREFAAYFGDDISGPLVELDCEQFNAVTGVWEDQQLTVTLANYIQNAIARAKK